MCREMEKMRNEAASKAAKEAELKTRIEMATELLKEGNMNHQTVSRISKLPLEEIDKIDSELKKLLCISKQ